jgi:hypothetical protein
MYDMPWLYLAQEANCRRDSVWRPIKHAVQDYPLALADGRTLLDDKLIAADYVKESFVGETYWLLHDPGMKIYYLNQQQPDEVVLFKQFDSDPTVATRMSPSYSLS